MFVYLTLLLSLSASFFSTSPELTEAIAKNAAVTTDPSSSEFRLGPTIRWELLASDRTSRTTTIRMTLVNGTDLPLVGGAWTLEWNQLGGRIDQESLPKGVRAERVSGDWHRMRFETPEWSLSRGDTLQMTFLLKGTIDRESYGPVGVFLYDAVTDTTLDVVSELHWREMSGLEALNMPTTASRYDSYAPGTILERDDLLWVIPAPVSITLLEGRVKGRSRGNGPQRGNGQGSEGRNMRVQGRTHTPWQVPKASLPDGVEITLQTDSTLPFEGYRLTLDGSTTRLEASSEQGFFYGRQTLLQLMDVARIEARSTLPAMRIEDHPRFVYRGLHFDIGRNFYGIDKLKQLLDWMAYFKLNRLHLNLTEDEGWRIEIPTLPELTQIGSRRGFTRDESEHLHPSYGSGPDPNRGLQDAGRRALGGGNGFLTRGEFVELLRYAKERHVQIIPEFNSPGHARAAVVSMAVRAERLLAQGDTAGANAYRLDDPDDASVYVSAQGYDDNVINVCRPGAIRFFTTVIDALSEMYEEAGVRLETYHLGGDELPYGIWKGSPICQSLMESQKELATSDDLLDLYLGQVLEVLDERGIRLAGWEDILLVHSQGSHNERRIQPRSGRTDIIPYVWNAAWGWGREDMIYRFANAGYEVVMSNSSAYYFDMADDRDPESIGLHWSGTVNHRMMWETEPMDLFLNPRWTGWQEASRERRDSLLFGRERLREEGRARFLGIQAQMWTETIRSEEILDAMMFPNLPIFADRAWGKESHWVEMAKAGAADSLVTTQRAAEWNIHANTIAQRIYPILLSRFGGVAPLLPKPGGVVSDGVLHVRTMFPGLQVRYSLDGGLPEEQSPVYTHPLPVQPGSRIVLRTFDSTGRGGKASDPIVVE